MIDIFMKWLIPFVCGAAITGCATYIRMRKRHDTALEDGVQCLLRAEIIRAHDKYTEKGFCPIYALEALKRAYAAYHALGGNDVATRLYEDILQLPTDPHANQNQGGVKNGGMDSAV